MSSGVGVGIRYLGRKGRGPEMRDCPTSDMAAVVGSRSTIALLQFITVVQQSFYDQRSRLTVIGRVSKHRCAGFCVGCLLRGRYVPKVDRTQHNNRRRIEAAESDTLCPGIESDLAILYNRLRAKISVCLLPVRVHIMIPSWHRTVLSYPPPFSAPGHISYATLYLCNERLSK